MHCFLFEIFFSSVPGVQGSLIKHFIGQWLYDTDCFNGLHDRKLCVLGFCQVNTIWQFFFQSHDKDVLISEGILTFVPFPKKKVPNLSPEQRFPPFTVNYLVKFSAQGRDLAPFFGNGTKVKIPSEIKLPLDCHLLRSLCDWKPFQSCFFTILLRVTRNDARPTACCSIKCITYCSKYSASQHWPRTWKYSVWSWIMWFPIAFFASMSLEH